MVDNVSNTNSNTPARRQLPWRGALVMVSAVVAFYLLREHWSHVAGSAAYLLLLACPLMRRCAVNRIEPKVSLSVPSRMTRCRRDGTPFTAR